MPDMKLNQNLRMVQTQKLALTQKIRQALEILQVPSMDLENIIRKELQDNPLLEQQGSDYRGEEEKKETDDSRLEGDSWDDEPSRSDSREDDALDILKKLDEHSGDSYTGTYRSDEDYWVPEPPSEPTLSEHLLDQIWAMMLRKELEEAATYIIYSLNSHGLLSLPLHDLQSVWEGDPALLGKALEIVRTLEPTGVGAMSASGALEMQLEKIGYGPESLERRIVSDHFNELAEKKFKAIASAEGVSPHAVQEAVDRISVLNPWPGNEFSSSANAAVIPDIIIVKIDDHFEAILNDSRFPHLLISARNRRILESPRTSPTEREYVKKKFQKASWFIKAIRQRQETVTRIGEYLAEFQRDFFMHGVEELKPLTLQMVADALGYNQSTISRAINGKYVQSPRGIHNMRFFFSRALPGESGEVSSRSVKEELRKIITAEDKSKPLSDSKLVQALEASGIEVKRRTVANYRTEMNIPSASKRKRY
jgi:RNA polymerase sigma-54 factor